jgi:hypothetical protein
VRALIVMNDDDDDVVVIDDELADDLHDMQCILNHPLHLIGVNPKRPQTLNPKPTGFAA